MLQAYMGRLQRSKKEEQSSLLVWNPAGGTGRRVACQASLQFARRDGHTVMCVI